MQELEKILEEIDGMIERYKENPRLEIVDICYGLNQAKRIIRKHLSRENTTEITRCSRDTQGAEHEINLPKEEFEMLRFSDSVTFRCGNEYVSLYMGEDEATREYKIVDDGWIPVEKYGLPKDEGVYDLTIIDGLEEYVSVRWQFLSGTHLSGTQHYVDGVHYWADNYRGDPINEFLSERVIAWRKKPEPYRPERRENDSKRI